jgi:hypothetical protein
MGSVHAQGDTFLTFGLKALTQTNTSRLATEAYILFCLLVLYFLSQFWYFQGMKWVSRNGTTIYKIVLMGNKGSTYNGSPETN